ncbi:hypothetical protein PFUGPA_05968 [Plasmodium falciparum Palo Alto/Uganda]|uniref:Rifin n=1 Tax=Plasmodium falciparum (isolate Palo Alto / Uganda) TaxID=57270 RepID=W4IQM7_PLAFP|nr:hypothetical protein PFUGPA_05968 [Plasmodium falciparum Palo Alto/Uganda]
MKLHFPKILLFFFPSNILLTSYHVYSKNKPSITSHHTQTNRSLCECDTQSSNYDKDTGMKSVMQQFVDRTSQRFEEYQERMKEKRQKRKEQRDKNVQEIIEKDKREKSLAEKVEQGCLRCGFGLGGVAAGVGIFGAIAVSEVKKAALVAAAQKGIAAGIEEAIQGIKTGFSLNELGGVALEKLFTAETFKKNMFFVGKIVEEYNRMCDNGTVEGSVFSLFRAKFPNKEDKVIESISASANNIALKAGKAAAAAEEAEITAANTASYNLYLAIAYSVIAILIIVVAMVIIYLILRYRRKKKMKKKLQYIKLLKE